jgi:hypothetical protein
VLIVDPANHDQGQPIVEERAIETVAQTMALALENLRGR